MFSPGGENSHKGNTRGANHPILCHLAASGAGREGTRRELTAALSRCVDVEPTESTTYTLTADGATGSASQQVTVTIGAAKAKILEVRVISLDLKAGNPVSI